MPELDRTRATFFLLGLSTALTLLAMPAQAVVIDSFRHGTNAVQVGGVAQPAVGRKAVHETGLSDVIGGARRVRVEATALQFPAADTISAVIVPETGQLVYDSSAGADGSVSLVYDRDGAGLNNDLSAARGIAVKISAADAAAMPCAVTLTITDHLGRSVSAQQTVTADGSSFVKFFFRSLGEIDLRGVRLIAVGIDPGAAGDLQVQWIRTFGRSPASRVVAAERGGRSKTGPHQATSKKVVGTP